MPFFTKSNKPSRSSQVKVVKAVNGGSRGHLERSRKEATRQPSKPQRRFLSQTGAQFHGFWDELEEREFAKQQRAASPLLTSSKIESFKRRTRQYSSETPQAHSRQSSTQRDGRDDSSSRSPQQDFWRKPTEQEEYQRVAASTKTSPPVATAVFLQKPKHIGFFSRMRRHSA